MKKTALLTLLISILLLTGCQDPIYEAIRGDVEPEEATVSGNIGQITRYTASGTEFLVLAADDGLRYKFKDDNHHDAWKTYSIPFSLHHYDFFSSSHEGSQILAVLADSTTLYLIAATYTNTSSEGLSYPDVIELWGKNITASGKVWNSAGDWTKITDSRAANNLFPIQQDDDTNFFYSYFNVFQTNAPKTANRKAYICTHNSDRTAFLYYQLNGLNQPSQISVTPIDPEPSSGSDYHPYAKSAVYFDGDVKFFTSSTATTDESYTADAEHYYYTNNDDRIYYASTTNPQPASFTANTKYVISNLATTADSILIGYGNLTGGSTGGIDRAILNNGVPVRLAEFETNAQFQMTSSYCVLALVNATPDQTELNSELYASISFSGTSYNFNSVGLWSYYPERGNWNRE